jgi:hypothetical protein
MALNDEIINLLDEFGKDFISDLQSSLSSKGSSFANSRLHGAIGQALSNAVFENGNFVIRFEIPSYYYWVDQDRQPGNVAESADDNIAEWGNSRGYIGNFMKNDLFNRQKEQLAAKQRARNRRKDGKPSKKRKYKTLKKKDFEKAKKQFVYLVKRKVARDGYSSKAKGFFSDVYNDGRIQTLTKVLSNLLGREIVVEFTRK